jgi:cell division transport system permease protein
MGTITISILLFGAFLLFIVNLNAWLLEWGQSLSMSVYLEDDIGEKGRRQIHEALKGLPNAEIRGYISKEEAMESLREAFGSQAALLDGFERNPLPASFELMFKDADVQSLHAEKIKEDLESIAGVEEVQYSEQWIDRFQGILSLIKAGGFIVGGLLCLAVLFITTNTIKLTIYARTDEIEIYKLVGATDGFVKVPFLLEGSFQGLIGGLIAVGVLYLVYSLMSLKPLYASAFPVLHVVFLPVWAWLGLAGLSVLLGLAGGLIAVGRFFHAGA